MNDEGINRILVVLFVLSILIYPIAIPIWIAATAVSVIIGWRQVWPNGDGGA